jgi:hypothetical protein
MAPMHNVHQVAMTYGVFFVCSSGVIDLRGLRFADVYYVGVPVNEMIVMQIPLHSRVFRHAHKLQYYSDNFDFGSDKT